MSILITNLPYINTIRGIFGTFGTFITLFLFLFSNLSYALPGFLPDLGNVDSFALDKSKEKVLGRVIIQDLHAHKIISEDALINDYIMQLGKKLSFYAPIKDQKYNFFVVNNAEVNAFAFFDGNVGVHLGSILVCDTESDLAAIMAHEIAHISQKHLSRHMAKNQRILPIAIVEAVAAIALGVPDLAIAALATHQMQVINYTREFEKEADRVGIKILKNAGFDPQSMANIFYLMQKVSRYQEMPPEYLITHPLFENRIADARNRANEYPYVQSVSSEGFHFAKARSKVIIAADLDGFINKLEANIKEKKYTNAAASNYALSLAYLENKNPKRALKVIQPFIRKYNNNIFINVLLSEIYEKFGNLQKSCDVLKEIHSVYPENPGIMLELAKAYINNKQLKRAESLLKDYNKNYESIQGYDLLVLTESKLKNNVDTHIYKAKWHILKGEMPKALRQLDIALEHCKDNVYDKAQVASLKKKIHKMISEQKRI